jgi:hypothetical protein
MVIGCAEGFDRAIAGSLQQPSIVAVGSSSNRTTKAPAAVGRRRARADALQVARICASLVFGSPGRPGRVGRGAGRGGTSSFCVAGLINQATGARMTPITRGRVARQRTGWRSRSGDAASAWLIVTVAAGAQCGVDARRAGAPL